MSVNFPGGAGPACPSHTSGVLVSEIEQRCGLTVAVALALTGMVPLVPDATAVLVSGALMWIVRLADSDWLAPGASGPPLPKMETAPGRARGQISAATVPVETK